MKYQNVLGTVLGLGLLLLGGRGEAGPVVPSALQQQLQKQVAFVVTGKVLSVSRKKDDDGRTNLRTTVVKLTAVSAKLTSFSRILKVGNTLRFQYHCLLSKPGQVKERGGYPMCKGKLAKIPPSLQKKKGDSTKMRLAVLRGGGAILFAVVPPPKIASQIAKGTLVSGS